jgi:putative NAD(P)H nitroreductase
MEAIEAIKSRRAINFFDPAKPMSEDAIREVLALASLAPSSSNLQPWEVVLVMDPERKKILRKCASNQAKVEEAPAVLIVIANPGAIEENIDRVLADRVEKGYAKPEDIGRQRNGPFKMYGERDSEVRRQFAVKNTAFFAMTFMIAARGMGYETHPMDGFNAADVKREFHIPEDRVIPLLIAVGHPSPSLKLLPRAFRRGVDEFTRMNDYSR